MSDTSIDKIHRGHARGARNANWKGGRSLEPGEIPHHIDGNKQNNAPENIQVVPSRSAHRTEHRRADSNLRPPGAANPVVPCACGCGATFATFDASGRPRRFVTGHNAGKRKVTP